MIVSVARGTPARQLTSIHTSSSQCRVLIRSKPTRANLCVSSRGRARAGTRSGTAATHDNGALQCMLHCVSRMHYTCLESVRPQPPCSHADRYTANIRYQRRAAMEACEIRREAEPMAAGRGTEAEAEGSGRVRPSGHRDIQSCGSVGNTEESEGRRRRKRRSKMDDGDLWTTAQASSRDGKRTPLRYTVDAIPLALYDLHGLHYAPTDSAVSSIGCRQRTVPRFCGKLRCAHSSVHRKPCLECAPAEVQPSRRP